MIDDDPVALATVDILEAQKSLARAMRVLLSAKIDGYDPPTPNRRSALDIYDLDSLHNAITQAYEKLRHAAYVGEVIGGRYRRAVTK